MQHHATSSNMQSCNMQGIMQHAIMQHARNHATSCNMQSCNIMQHRATSCNVRNHATLTAPHVWPERKDSCNINSTIVRACTKPTQHHTGDQEEKVCKSRRTPHRWSNVRACTKPTQHRTGDQAT